MPERVLIAAFGNPLLGDDGFGPAVLERLAAGPLPDHVTLLDVGTAGIRLVQELLGDGWSALLIVDAVDRGAAPGTVTLLEPDVPDVLGWPAARRRVLLADPHFTSPARALVLARALGRLPPRVAMVGCQPVSAELALGLSPPLRAAVDESVRLVMAWLADISTPRTAGLPTGRARSGRADAAPLEPIRGRRLRRGGCGGRA